MSEEIMKEKYYDKKFIELKVIGFVFI